MKIHEYQAKELLRAHGVPVPRGYPAFNVREAREAAQKLGGAVWVVKAQIHAGGRGKGGGVKLARSGPGSVGIDVYEGSHLRLTLGDAVQAGAYQVFGGEFATRQKRSCLPGLQPMKWGGVVGGHGFEYLCFCRTLACGGFIRVTTLGTDGHSYFGDVGSDWPLAAPIGLATRAHCLAG